MKSNETISCGGIILNGKKVLVVNQKGNSWSLPKGHIEQNETLLQAAYREIYEETGIQSLELIQYLGSYKRYKIGKNIDIEDKSELKHIHFFLFTTMISQSSSNDPDNPEISWVDINDVDKKLTHPKDIAFYNSVKEILLLYTNTFIQIDTTTSTFDEAKELSNKLVEKQLAACIQLQPIHSIYKWNNEIQNEKEYKITIKTLQRNLSSINELFKKHHPYECPEFIVTKVIASTSEYTKWLTQSSVADSILGVEIN